MRMNKKLTFTRKLTGFLGILWSLIILAAAVISYREITQAAYDLALNEARATVNKDVSFRLWVTSHGGVYVRPTDATPPSPYLSHVPDRDVTTSKGWMLTLMNPAYVLRQVMEKHSKLYDVRGHITSLKPMRAGNAPDTWEIKSLESFEKGVPEAAEMSTLDNRLYLRYMQPLTTQDGCLKCHANQGYKKGDIRGGISTSIPMDKYLAIKQSSLRKSVLSYIILWVLGIGGLVVMGRLLERDLLIQRKKDEEFESVFNLASDLVCISGMTHFLKVNPSFSRILGYSAEELTARPFMEFIHPDDIEPTRKAVEEKLTKGISVFNFINRYRNMNGGYRWLEWMTHVIPAENILYATARDITERIEAEEQNKLNQERMESLIKISQHKAGNLQELLDYALEEAIRLTRSRIGYIYFYSEEKKEFTLNTWSREVMTECTILDPQSIYPLESTGIWGEAVRQRKPVLINDFQAPDPLKKGYPGGHAKLHRFLTIPVFNQGRIELVVGVANKETGYDTSDVNQLMLLMDTVWKLAEKKRAEDEIIRSLNEKSVLLREIHHRTKNNMAVMLSLLELQSGYVNDEESKSLFRESCNRIKTMALVHEKLYKSRDFSNIEIREYITDLAKELLSAYDDRNMAIGLKLDVDICTMPLDTLIPLGLIVNEIMVNSIKHAFPVTGDYHSPEISVSLHVTEGSRVNLEIRDNGVGIPEDHVLAGKKTLGQQIIRALISQLDAVMTIEREHGTLFRISYPLGKY